MSTAADITTFETAVCAPALQFTADRENDPVTSIPIHPKSQKTVTNKQRHKEGLIGK